MREEIVVMMVTVVAVRMMMTTKWPDARKLA
jgi:hypothetical protein